MWNVKTSSEWEKIRRGWIERKEGRKDARNRKQIRPEKNVSRGICTCDALAVTYRASNDIAQTTDFSPPVNGLVSPETWELLFSPDNFK